MNRIAQSKRKVIDKKGFEDMFYHRRWFLIMVSIVNIDDTKSHITSYVQGESYLD